MRLTFVRSVPTVLLMGSAVALAWALYVIGDQPTIYDASEYVRFSQILGDRRFDNWEDRTYGYPALLVPWVILSDNDLTWLRWNVFLAQVAAHLGASWLFARRVTAAFDDDRLGRLTLVLLVLNPFVLIMTSVLLADLMSTVLATLGTALLLPARTERRSAVVRDGALALFALALATEVRPATGILLPVGTVCWMIRWRLVARYDVRTLIGGLVLVGAVAVLPLIPQSLLNWHAHGQTTPLVVNSLYSNHMNWGLYTIKRVTLVLYGGLGEPAMSYKSPFWAGQTSVLEYARTNPLGLVVTLALHGFALFHQDFPFPYTRETDPWHRWPLESLGYLFLWAAVMGLVVGWRRWWRPGTRFAWGAITAMAAAYFLVYLPSVIETRYGLALYTLLAPAASMALLAVRDWVRARAWGRVAGSGATALLTVGVCALLSIWMQTLSPILILTRELRDSPGPLLPVARFEGPPPDRWTVGRQQTYVVRATNLGERPWNATMTAQIFLHVMFVGPGEVEQVDSRVEAWLPITHDVQPGEPLVMEVTVTAPRKEGTYRLRQQLELGEKTGRTASPPFDTLVMVNERRQRR